MKHSYHRSEDRAAALADQLGGFVEAGEHPDPEYNGLTVWWVVIPCCDRHALNPENPDPCAIWLNADTPDGCEVNVE